MSSILNTRLHRLGLVLDAYLTLKARFVQTEAKWVESLPKTGD